MKLMKGFGYIIAVLMFCLGVGICCAHQSMKHVFTAPAIDAAVDKLVDTTVSYGAKSLYAYLPESIQQELPPTDEIIRMLPASVQTKLEEAKQTIAEDPQVNELLTKYSEALITKLDDETAQLPNIQKDVEAIIEVKLPLVATALGVEFSQTEVTRIAQEIATDVDLQPVMEQGIEELRENLTPTQSKLLSFVSFVQSNRSIWVASFCFGICVVLLILIKRSLIKALPFVGVLSILGGGFIFAGALSAKVLLEEDVLLMADGVFTSLNDTCALFILVGIGLLFIYGILKLFSRFFHEKQSEASV